MNPIDKCKDQFKKCKITATQKMSWDYGDSWTEPEVVAGSPPPPPQDKYEEAAQLGPAIKYPVPFHEKGGLKKKRRKRKRSKYRKSKQRLKSKKKKKKSIRRKIRKTKN